MMNRHLENIRIQHNLYSLNLISIEFDFESDLLIINRKERKNLIE